MFFGGANQGESTATQDVQSIVDSVRKVLNKQHLNFCLQLAENSARLCIYQGKSFQAFKTFGLLKTFKTEGELSK